MTGRQKHDVTGDEASVLLKQPRFDQDQAVTGKENLQVRKDTGYANLNDRHSLFRPKSWARDHSPPRRFGLTPPPQLTVRKTRQAQRGAHARVHPDKRTDSSCTFPAGYGVRSVKSRPPLSNICDEAALAETLPSTLHAPCREGHALPLSELPFPAASLASIRQPRQSCVLAPHIVVTPEATALEPGRHSLWAAIEISGRLWPASESVIEPGPCRERSGCSKSLAGCDQQGRSERRTLSAMDNEALTLQGTHLNLAAFTTSKSKSCQQKNHLLSGFCRTNLSPCERGMPDAAEVTTWTGH